MKKNLKKTIAGVMALSMAASMTLDSPILADYIRTSIVASATENFSNQSSNVSGLEISWDNPSKTLTFTGGEIDGSSDYTSLNYEHVETALKTAEEEKGVVLSEIKHIVFDGNIQEVAGGFWGAFQPYNDSHAALLSALETVRSDTVTTVGGKAFAGCSSLVSVSFPNVTEIGSIAFSGCINLVSISNINNLAAVNVGEQAFSGTGLAAGTYRFTVEDAQQYSAMTNGKNGGTNTPGAGTGKRHLYGNEGNWNSGDVGLKIATLKKLLGENYKMKNVILSEDITEIGGRAFYNCTDLESIFAPQVYRIDKEAFAGCTSLKSISTMPDLRRYKDPDNTPCEEGDPAPTNSLVDAFKGTPLADGEYCFTEEDAGEDKSVIRAEYNEKLEFLKNITNNTELTFTEVTAVEGVSLKYEKIPSTFDEATGKLTFDGIYTETGDEVLTTDDVKMALKRWKISADNVTALEIKGTVEEIGNSAFEGFEYVTTLTLSTTVETIGKSAFKDCKKLQTLNIPSVTKIDNSAFENCALLEKIVLKQGVEIGAIAFKGTNAEFILLYPNQTDYNLTNATSIPSTDTSYKYAEYYQWRQEENVTEGNKFDSYWYQLGSDIYIVAANDAPWDINNLENKLSGINNVYYNGKLVYCVAGTSTAWVDSKGTTLNVTTTKANQTFTETEYDAWVATFGVNAIDSVVLENYTKCDLQYFFSTYASLKSITLKNETYTRWSDGDDSAYYSYKDNKVLIEGEEVIWKDKENKLLKQLPDQLSEELLGVESVFIKEGTAANEVQVYGKYGELGENFWISSKDGTSVYMSGDCTPAIFGNLPVKSTATSLTIGGITNAGDLFAAYSNLNKVTVVDGNVEVEYKPWKTATETGSVAVGSYSENAGIITVYPKTGLSGAAVWSLANYALNISDLSKTVMVGSTCVHKQYSYGEGQTATWTLKSLEPAANGNWQLETNIGEATQFTKTAEDALLVSFDHGDDTIDLFVDYVVPQGGTFDVSNKNVLLTNKVKSINFNGQTAYLWNDAADAYWYKDAVNPNNVTIDVPKDNLGDAWINMPDTIVPNINGKVAGILNAENPAMPNSISIKLKGVEGTVQVLGKVGDSDVYWIQGVNGDGDTPTGDGNYHFFKLKETGIEVDGTFAWSAEFFKSDAVQKADGNSFQLSTAKSICVGDVLCYYKETFGEGDAAKDVAWYATDKDGKNIALLMTGSEWGSFADKTHWKNLNSVSIDNGSTTTLVGSWFDDADETQTPQQDATYKAYWYAEDADKETVHIAYIGVLDGNGNIMTAAILEDLNASLGTNNTNTFALVLDEGITANTITNLFAAADADGSTLAKLSYIEVAGIKYYPWKDANSSYYWYSEDNKVITIQNDDGDDKIDWVENGKELADKLDLTGIDAIKIGQTQVFGELNKDKGIYGYAEKKDSDDDIVAFKLSFSEGKKAEWSAADWDENSLAVNGDYSAITGRYATVSVEVVDDQGAISKSVVYDTFDNGYWYTSAKTAAATGAKWNVTAVCTSGEGGDKAFKTKVLNNMKGDDTIDLTLDGFTSVVKSNDTDKFGKVLSLKSESITKVSNYEFTAFKALTTVTLKNAEEIGEGAFNGCKALTTVNLPAAKTIGQYAFFDCSALKNVDVQAAKEIGGSAFASCTALETINLPSVETIGMDAFYLCAVLATVTLPESTAFTIGESAFNGCEKLASINLSKATAIGAGAFINCKALNTVDLSSAATIGKSAFYCCAGLTAVTLSQSLTAIPAATFMGCEVLDTINLGNVTTIGGQAFSGCKALASVDLTSVETIGPAAFMGCGLTKVDAPAVIEIDGFAFAACANLEEATLGAKDGMVTFNGNVFGEYQKGATPAEDLDTRCKNLVYVKVRGAYYGTENAVAGLEEQSITFRYQSKAANWDEAAKSNFTENVTLIPYDEVTFTDSLETVKDLVDAETEKVILLGDIKNIGSKVFDGYTGLTTVVLPDYVMNEGKKIDDQFVIAADAFVTKPKVQITSQTELTFENVDEITSKQTISEYSYEFTMPDAEVAIYHKHAFKFKNVDKENNVDKTVLRGFCTNDKSSVPFNVEIARLDVTVNGSAIEPNANKEQILEYLDNADVKITQNLNVEDFEIEGKIKKSFYTYDAENEENDYRGTYLKAMPTDAGKYIVVAEFSVNGTLSYLERVFEIMPRSIDEQQVVVTVKNDGSEYTGNEIAADFTVVDEKTKTEENAGFALTEKEFTVTGVTSATEVGEYEFTLKGIGNYTGTKTVEWEIAKQTLKDFNVTLDVDTNGEKTYDGKAVDVKVDETNLPMKDIDLTIEYFADGDTTPLSEAPIDCGKYKVVVTANKEGTEKYNKNYTTKSVEKDYEIVKRDVIITLTDEITNVKYGTAKSGDIAIDYTFDGVLDKDKVGFTDNRKMFTAVGYDKANGDVYSETGERKQYAIELNSEYMTQYFGNYNVQLVPDTKSFVEVDPIELNDPLLKIEPIAPFDGNFDYTGETQSVAGWFKVTYEDSVWLAEKTDKTLYPDVSEVSVLRGDVEQKYVGTYELQIDASQSKCNITGRNEVEWSIGIAKTPYAVESITYGDELNYIIGEGKNTSLTLKDGDTVEYQFYSVKEGSQDEPLDEAPVNAGKYYVIATITDSQNNVSKYRADFTIDKQEVSYKTNNLNITYGDELPTEGLISFYANGEQITDDAVKALATCSYVDEAGEAITPVNVGTYSYAVKADGTADNYVLSETNENAGKLTIAEKTLTTDLLDIDNTINNNVLRKDGDFVTMEFVTKLVEGVDFKVNTGARTSYEAGTFDVEVEGQGNYTGKLKLQWTVKQAEKFADRNYSHNVSLNNDLSIGFYVSASDLDGMENVRLEVTNSSGETVKLTGALGVYDANYGKEYYFKYNGIAAKQAGDEVTAKLVGEKDGIVYEFNEDTYSISTYCYKQLNKSSDPELKKVLVDLLNYCADAQLYFGYNTTHLVNEKLTDEWKALATPDSALNLESQAATLNKLANPTAEITAKSLDLGSNLGLVFTMNIEAVENKDNLVLHVSYKDREGKTVTKDIAYSEFQKLPYSNQYGQEYRANYIGLTATDFNTAVEVTIMDGDTAISDTITYSVETYAYNQVNKTTSSASLKNLLRSLMKYAASANEFFAK